MHLSERTPASAPLELPGPLRGRYEDPERLGEGTFGVVLRANDRELGRRVAIKLLRSETLDNPGVRERFLREGRLPAQLKHRHMAEVFDHGVEGGAAWLVMEYVPGGTLRELAASRGGRLDPERVVLLVDQVLAGLAVAHAAGVVHRDLKPDNVLLREDGSAVITDFGLARGLEDERVTRTGTVVGTPAYMAPEQMRGDAPAPAWDLYAVGVMAYELLSGFVPFEGDGLAEILQVKLAGSLPPGPGVGPYRSVLLRALDPEPQARFPDAASFTAALEGARARAAAVGERATVTLGESGGDDVVATAPLRRAGPEASSAPEGAATLQTRSASGVPPRRRSRQGPALATFVAAGLALAFLWGSLDPGAEPAAPLEAPEEEPAGPPHGDLALTEALRAFRMELDADPQVLAAGALADPMPIDDAVATWDTGRQRFRALAGRSRLMELLAARSEGVLAGPALQAAIADVLLVGRILHRTRSSAAEPVQPGPVLRRLEELAAAGTRVWRVPELERERTFPEGGFTGPRPWALLGEWRRAQEPEWLPIWGRAQAAEGQHEVVGVNTRFQILNLEGVRYVDPTPRDLLALSGARWSTEFNERGYEFAHREVAEPFPFEPAGDLELLFWHQAWDSSTQGVLTLRGGEVNFRKVITPPDPGKKEGWVGLAFRLRLDRDLLPEGIRRVGMEFRGLQPVGNSQPTVSLHALLARQAPGGEGGR